MTRLILAALLALAAPASAEPLARTLFGAMREPSGGISEAIGSYAKGCAAGLVAMPETGPSWQAMRLGRNRNWGQPVMIDYLEDLSLVAQGLGWAGLYIGDISQPRGGPMTGDHASHQIGLDADVWMLPPRRLNLTRSERENISSISVRTADQKSINENWTPVHAALLQAAASDPRVERIFVAAAVKLELCRAATRRDKSWLQKIRPIAGHNTHFHVRLRCPEGSVNCVTQTPTVSELSNGGNGCDDSLTWWVTTYLEPPKKPTGPKPPKPSGPPPRNATTYILADLPNQCASVLSAN
jgi:penicillin-insensitive murein endopeptidase